MDNKPCDCTKNEDKLDTDVFKFMPKSTLKVIYEAAQVDPSSIYDDIIKDKIKEAATKSNKKLRTFISDLVGEDKVKASEVLLAKYQFGGQLEEKDDPKFLEWIESLIKVGKIKREQVKPLKNQLKKIYIEESSKQKPTFKKGGLLYKI